MQSLLVGSFAIGHVSEKAEQQYTYEWNDLLEKRLKTFVEKGEIHGIRKTM